MSVSPGVITEKVKQVVDGVLENPGDWLELTLRCLNRIGDELGVKLDTAREQFLVIQIIKHLDEVTVDSVRTLGEAGVWTEMPGMREFLSMLKEKGIPIGILTGARRPYAEATLQALGHSGVVKHLMTREDVQLPKPHPSGWVVNLSALGESPCEGSRSVSVVTEDNAVNAVGAVYGLVEAGVDAFGIIVCRDGACPTTTYSRILEQCPAKLTRSLRKEVSEVDVEKVIERCTFFDPDNDPLTFSSFGTALNAVL
jgi:beta-phosphoglucomutase-like phosphatase (HAD superfamily)